MSIKINWPDLWFGPINLYSVWNMDKIPYIATWVYDDETVVTRGRLDMSGGIEEMHREEQNGVHNSSIIRHKIDYVSERKQKMSLMNRLGNCKNPFQGNYKKVLCVCSAGLLRSATTAVVLSAEPYNYNTRNAGLSDEYALIPVDDVLLSWADEIVCMDEYQEGVIRQRIEDLGEEKEVICLHIPDSFAYRDPDLVKIIKTNYTNATVAEAA